MYATSAKGWALFDGSHTCRVFKSSGVSSRNINNETAPWGPNRSVALQGYKLFIRNDLVVDVKTGYYLTRTRITPCHTRTQTLMDVLTRWYERETRYKLKRSVDNRISKTGSRVQSGYILLRIGAHVSAGSVNCGGNSWHSQRLLIAHAGLLTHNGKSNGKSRMSEPRISWILADQKGICSALWASYNLSQAYDFSFPFPRKKESFSALVVLPT